MRLEKPFARRRARSIEFSGSRFSVPGGTRNRESALLANSGQAIDPWDQAQVEILGYSYDANGRLVTRWSKAKGTTSYGYDDVGNLVGVNCVCGRTTASVSVRVGSCRSTLASEAYGAIIRPEGSPIPLWQPAPPSAASARG